MVIDHLITLSLFELQFKSSQIENYFQYCFRVLVWAFPFGGLLLHPPPPLIIMLKRENGHNFHPFPWKKSFLSKLVCSRSRIVMPTWACKRNWALWHTSDASPWCLDSRKPEGFHLMPGLLWMAEENGISNVDNDAQVQALIYTGPKENTTQCGPQKVMLMNVALCFCGSQLGKRAEPPQMKPHPIIPAELCGQWRNKPIHSKTL